MTRQGEKGEKIRDSSMKFQWNSNKWSNFGTNMGTVILQKLSTVADCIYVNHN